MNRSMNRSSSVPSLPSIPSGGFQLAVASTAQALRGPADPAKWGRSWAPEQKRLLHQSRERQWLRSKARHGYIDFSDTERAELRRYFNALAGQRGRVGIDKLENMLISLGLAGDRREVAAIVERIDTDCAGELDFEQYLEIVRTRTDSNIFQVFKAMMEGKLGDRNLNFQTVISTYRRKLIIDATGARGVRGEQQETGERILGNFAALQRSRHAEAKQAADDARQAPPTAGGPGAERAERDDSKDSRRPGSDRLSSKRPESSLESELPSPRSAGSAGVDEEAVLAAVREDDLGPSFELAHQAAPMGTLNMVWRGVCHEHSLVSSRPASADGRSRSALERPMSPSKVVEAIVKSRPGRKRQQGGSGGTIVVSAPIIEGEGSPLGSTLGRSRSRGLA